MTVSTRFSKLRLILRGVSEGYPKLRLILPGGIVTRVAWGGKGPGGLRRSWGGDVGGAARKEAWRNLAVAWGEWRTGGADAKV